MAKAPSKAKSSTVKVGKTTIKGATDADKQNIQLAKDSLTTQADETPEAKKSAPAQKAAAKEQFAKADAKAEPESRRLAREAAALSPEKLAEQIETNRASLAVRGW